MHYIEGVKKTDTHDYLLENSTGLLLRQMAFGIDIIEQIFAVD